VLVTAFVSWIGKNGPAIVIGYSSHRLCSIFGLIFSLIAYVFLIRFLNSSIPGYTIINYFIEMAEANDIPFLYHISYFIKWINDLLVTTIGQSYLEQPWGNGTVFWGASSEWWGNILISLGIIIGFYILLVLITRTSDKIADSDYEAMQRAEEANRRKAKKYHVETTADVDYTGNLTFYSRTVDDTNYEYAPGTFLIFVISVVCGAIFAPALSLVWFTIDVIVHIIKNY